MVLFVFCNKLLLLEFVRQRFKGTIFFSFCIDLTEGGVFVFFFLPMRVAQLVFMEFVSQRLKVTIFFAPIAQFFRSVAPFFLFFHLTRMFFCSRYPSWEAISR
jgi:hypothetical protein